jgi:hypothetical protein
MTVKSTKEGEGKQQAMTPEFSRQNSAGAKESGGKLPHALQNAAAIPEEFSRDGR